MDSKVRACFLAFFFSGIFLFTLPFFFPVSAQICYDTRVVDQWACLSSETGGCPPLNLHWRCVGGDSRLCENAAGEKDESKCYPIPNLPYPPLDYRPCVQVCDGFYVGNFCASTGNQYVECTDPPSCQWAGTLKDCYYDTNNQACVETTSNLVYGCWGPGVAPTPTLAVPADCGNGTCGVGEDCSNCSSDCGACPPVPPLCPNGQCDIAEDCANCAVDCGVCSTASVQARAVAVGADISCTALAAPTNFLGGTSFSLSPAVSPVSQTQSGGSYVSWPSVPVSDPISGSLYSLSAVPPSADNVLKNVCYTKTGAAPYTQSSSATIFPVETVTWNVGYGPPGAWMQTGGGDVCAAGSITSLLPAAVSPRQFNLDGPPAGGFPGIVTYGASGLNAYDFDISAGSQGETLVSVTNWLVNESFTARDFYSYYLSVGL